MGLSTNPLDSSEAPGPVKAWQDHECACHSWDGRTALWAMGHPVRGLHSSHAPPTPPRAWVAGQGQEPKTPPSNCRLGGKQKVLGGEARPHQTVSEHRLRAGGAARV